MLVQTPGIRASRALSDMWAQESETNVKDWLQARVIEHAAREADAHAKISPADLKALGAPLLSEPAARRSSSPMWLGAPGEKIESASKQVPSATETSCASTFQRRICSAGWPPACATRPTAASSIHREEEVDRSKKTDIQVSCKSGNVCLETKALDAHRSYSANSLTDTLQTQIVDQYLKGFKQCSWHPRPVPPG